MVAKNCIGSIIQSSSNTVIFLQNVHNDELYVYIIIYLEIVSILFVPLYTGVILSYVQDVFCFCFYCIYCILCHVQAPVPLSIFRSNSKFDENSKHSSVQYTRPITTIFCTRHDSVTVVTCAKYRCDRSSIFETRAFWIFIEFRIRSKYA